MKNKEVSPTQQPDGGSGINRQQSYGHSSLRRVRAAAVTAAVGMAALLPFTLAPANAAAQSTTGPVAQEFPNQYFPENLPGNDVAQYFPREWKTYGSIAGRNAVFPLTASAPDSLKNGVEWSFAGAGAIPLNGPPLGGDFKITAYTIGMPVGVSVVQGILYVGDDNGYTYAVNAVTGKLIWSILKNQQDPYKT